MDFPQRGAAATPLLQRNLPMLGQRFQRHPQSTEEQDFSGLLARIDAADLHYRGTSE